MTITGNVYIYGDILQNGATKTQSYTYYIKHVDNFNSTMTPDTVAPDDPVMALFDRLTREAIGQHPGEWKEILKPYRTAVDAGAMDRCFTREQFNKHFGVEVSVQAFSHWMSSTQEQYQYRDDENASMRAKFEGLKKANE